MGSPTIFSGRRTKLLTADGIETKDGQILDYQGDVNYVPNGHLAKNDDGWNTYADSGDTPTDGTGGVPNRITIQRSGSTALRGQGSLQIDKAVPSAGDDVGEGVSVDLNAIDQADVGNVLSVSFDYVCDSDYVDDDMGIWIYDIDNSTLIEPVGHLLKASRVNGRFSAQFQTTYNSSPSSADSYRLILHQRVTNSAAVTIWAGNFRIGPPNRQFGVPSTDWTSYTASATWTTNTTTTAKWKRVGDSMDLHVHLETSGAPDAAQLKFDLPPGYTIDTAKLPNSGINTWVGTGTVLEAGTGRTVATVGYSDTNTLQPYVQREGSGVSNSLDVITESNLFTVGAGDAFDFLARIPIVGFSTNVQMSDSSDGRLVAIEYSGNAGTSLTANVTNIDWDDETQDTHGLWNGTQATILESGVYQFKGTMRISSANTNQVGLYVDGSLRYVVGGNISTVRKHFTGQSYFSAGEVVSFRFSGSSTLVDTPSQHWLMLSKVQGPSAIAANETITFSAVRDASTQSIGTSATELVFDNDKENSHGFYDNSTGRFTAGVAGTYAFFSNLIIKTGGSAPTSLRSYFHKNGSGTKYGNNEESYTFEASKSYRSNLSVLIPMNAGDYVSLWGVSLANASTLDNSGGDGENSVLHGYRIGF